MRKFIFIWFLAVGLISVVGAMWTVRSIRVAAWGLYGSNLVRYTAATVADALDRGEVAALNTLGRRIDPEGNMRLFVFDAGMNEISTDPPPDPVRTLAGRLRVERKAQYRLFNGGLLAGSMVGGREGRAYRVVLWFPTRRFAGVSVRMWAWGGRLAAIIAGAGLLCSWLAWRLSAPLRRLREAARRFAAGDLKARADASAFPSNVPEYQELACDFDEMAGRIQTLVDSQRQLLRDVSHELRTPLTRLSLAVNNARHSAGPAVERSLDRIDQESDRLNMLIERIIRLSRFETCAELPRREPIEFADFLESIVSDADFEATARQRRVLIVQAEMCRIAGDRELLREAIENIVRNAIRYTPEGTTVKVDAGRVTPSEYRIAVRDCGPGVPEEHIAAIFQPFHRAPQRADQISPGFGVGLAIARRAVGLHQGTITARNLAEGGFEIAIHLPIEATTA